MISEQLEKKFAVIGFCAYFSVSVKKLLYFLKGCLLTREMEAVLLWLVEEFCCARDLLVLTNCLGPMRI